MEFLRQNIEVKDIAGESTKAHYITSKPIEFHGRENLKHEEILFLCLIFNQVWNWSNFTLIRDLQFLKLIVCTAPM